MCVHDRDVTQRIPTEVQESNGTQHTHLCNGVMCSIQISFDAFDQFLVKKGVCPVAKKTGLAIVFSQGTVVLSDKKGGWIVFTTASRGLAKDQTQNGRLGSKCATALLSAWLLGFQENFPFLCLPLHFFVVCLRSVCVSFVVWWQKNKSFFLTVIAFQLKIEATI